MSSTYGHGSNRRKRLSGVLNHGSRGLSILTDAGDMWVIDREDVDPCLLGRRVTAEGIQSGYDRLMVDWLGEAHC